MKEYNFCPYCATPLGKKMIEGRERKFCAKCDFIDFKNPLPVVAAVAFRGKEFLLIKRKRDPRIGHWAFPAGYVELAETLEEACLRELFEETGMSGRVVRLLEVFHRAVKEHSEEVIISAFLVEVTSGSLKPGDDVDGVGFFKAEDLLELYSDNLEYYREHYEGVIEEIKNSKK